MAKSQKAKAQSMTAHKTGHVTDFDTRRPPKNPAMPKEIIARLAQTFNSAKKELEEYAAHLRSQDRRRLNGVGIKKQGFIERVFAFAEDNPEFLPHYLSLEKFREDGEYFLGFRNLTDELDQLRELAWNVTTLSSKGWYRDSLDYYASVKEAAKRRIDPAESIYKALGPFFGRPSKKDADGKPALTKKKALRDAKAVADGKKNGVVMIENQKPHLEGGVHKVIDEVVGE